MCTQSLAGQFEQLALGPGGPTAPGQPPEQPADPRQYPRPLASGAGDAPPPSEPRSCDPTFMRPTVNAVPSTLALKTRHAPVGSRQMLVLQHALGPVSCMCCSS